jgi:hypothetical protein
MRTYLFFVHLLVVLLSLFLIACGGGGGGKSSGGGGSESSGGGQSACEKFIDKTNSCCHLSVSSDKRRQAIQSCEEEYNKLSSDDKKAFDEWVDNATCSDIADIAASEGETCET